MSFPRGRGRAEPRFCDSHEAPARRRRDVAVGRNPAFASRKSWTVDISTNVGGRILVIGYGGAHWYNTPEKLLVDERKSVDLLAAGHLVVRPREDDLPGLPIVHPCYLEVRVYSSAPRTSIVMDEVRGWAQGVVSAAR